MSFKQIRSNTIHSEIVSKFVDGFKLDYFLALSISINVVSGKKSKEWRDKNLSGYYHMVEIVNDRPVYKVSIKYLQGTLATKSLLLMNFSETKKLMMAMKYISGTMKH